ncbi:MAG: capsule synthesis protein CapA [Pseudomonadota bacterium]|jgi:poly-gamma-glutamate capsule biosynthesis protein CapA/YwtB (metallophosphatase superfamily)
MGAVALAGCAGETGPGSVWRSDLDARAAWANTPIAWQGRVVDEDGRGVAGARVAVQGREVSTDAEGRFQIDGLARRAATVVVTAPGFRDGFGAVSLSQAADVASVDAPLPPLRRVDEGETRFLFTGDVALGRRYLDPEDATPIDQVPANNPDAVLRVDHLEEDALALIAEIAPLFAVADVAIPNFESVVTDAPTTPHRTKDFVYFTLPASLIAFEALGIGIVGLGNNHVYDYLEQGVADTLRFLTAAGLRFAGLGASPDAAWVPLRFDAQGTPWTMVAATSIVGRPSQPPSYVAEEGKGGAADLTDRTRLARTVEGERDAGRVPFAMVHMGFEYTRAPTDGTRSHAEAMIDAGAAFVIGHHPHTVQGFELVEDRFVAWSLGNFMFDQDRLETMHSFTLQLDADAVGWHAATAWPIVIEDYRPLALAGERATRLRLEAGERTGGGLSVVGDANDLRILPEERTEVRTLTRQVDVVIGPDGFGHADLRALLSPGESVVGVEGDVAEVWLGRDRMWEGDFEDEDTDDAQLECAFWDLGLSGLVTVEDAYRGVGALALYRDAIDEARAAAAFRYRVRVPGDAEGEPNKDVAVFGWVSGDGAGAWDVEASWESSYGDAVFGRETLLDGPGGTFGWTPFVRYVHLPAERFDVLDPEAENARAVRLFLHMDPPTEAPGRVRFDDLAVVGWELGPFEPSAAFGVPNRHGLQFLRVSGDPGGATLRLTVAAVDADR